MKRRNQVKNLGSYERMVCTTVMAAANVLFAVGLQTARADDPPPFDVIGYSARANYTNDNGPWFSGHFDDDGLADLVHIPTTHVNGYIDVWLSKGDGTYDVHAFTAWNGYNNGDGPWLDGDFNGDGLTDLLHVVNSGDHVDVWLSQGRQSNGQVTFVVDAYTPTSQAGPLGVGQYTVMDYNGDGLSDVVHRLPQPYDHIDIWVSNGDGTFTATVFIPTQGYDNPEQGDWLSGDFNRDGRDDMVQLYYSETDCQYNRCVAIRLWLSDPGVGFLGYSDRYEFGEGETEYIGAVSGNHIGKGASDDIVFLVLRWGLARPHLITWNPETLEFNIAVNLEDNSYSHEWWFGAGPISPDVNGDGYEDLMLFDSAGHYFSGADIWYHFVYGELSQIQPQVIFAYTPWSSYTITSDYWLWGDVDGDARDDIIHIPPTKDYLNTWLSRIGPAGAASVEHIEVTQGIQNMANDMQIVPGKDVIVRAYVGMEYAVGNTTEVFLTAELRVQEAGSSADPDVYPPITPVVLYVDDDVDMAARRMEFGKTLNFRIPGAAFEPNKTYRFSLGKVMDESSPEDEIVCYNCLDVYVQQSVSDAAVLRLQTVGLTYIHDGEFHVPEADEQEAILHWVQSAFPAVVDAAPYTVTPSWVPWPFSCLQANAQVAAIRAAAIDGGADPRTRFLGLVQVPEQLGFAQALNCAQSIPDTPDPGVVGTIQANGVSESYWMLPSELHVRRWGEGENAAQVLGNMLGRDIVPGTEYVLEPVPCSTFHTVFDESYPYVDGTMNPPYVVDAADGLDYVGLYYREDTYASLYLPIFNTSTTSPAVWYDVMTDCQLRWISNYTSEAIREVLVAENGSTGIQVGDFAYVNAFVDTANASGNLLAMRRLSRASVTSTDIDGAPNVDVVFVDGTGTVVYTGAFPVQASTAAGEDVGTVEALIPIADIGFADPGGLTVRVELEGEVLDSAPISAAAPGVTDLAVATVNSWSEVESGELAVSWQGQDADAGTTLTYDVLLSADVGASWRLAAHGLGDTTFVLQPAHVEGMDSAMVRVVATDGFHAGAASSGVFPVPEQPDDTPVAHDYVYPEQMASYTAGTAVLAMDGNVYACLPYPNSEWCNDDPQYYAPGTGSAWEQAWEYVGEGPENPPAPAPEHVYPDGIGDYAVGTLVEGGDAALYRCLVAAWCNGDAAYYAPGGGYHWDQAWERINQ